MTYAGRLARVVLLRRFFVITTLLTKGLRHLEGSPRPTTPLRVGEYHPTGRRGASGTTPWDVSDRSSVC